MAMNLKIKSDHYYSGRNTANGGSKSCIYDYTCVQ